MIRASSFIFSKIPAGGLGDWSPSVRLGLQPGANACFLETRCLALTVECHEVPS